MHRVKYSTQWILKNVQNMLHILNLVEPIQRCKLWFWGFYNAGLENWCTVKRVHVIISSMGAHGFPRNDVEEQHKSHRNQNIAYTWCTYYYFLRTWSLKLYNPIQSNSNFETRTHKPPTRRLDFFKNYF